MVRVGEHQGDRPWEEGANRPRRLRGPIPATSSRIASAEKYMTAEGLPSIAALDPLDALDRGRIERVTGEAVEAVCGEDGDPAAGDAARQR